MIEPQTIVAYARHTGRLKLSFGDAVTFYKAGILFAALFLDVIFMIVWGINFIEDEALILVNILALIAFLIVFAIRRRALRFTIIETKLPRERLLLLLEEVIEYYGWEIKVFSPDIIILDDLKILDRTFDPPLDMQRITGQRITIVFDHNKVYANSILNIYKLSGWRGGGFGNRKASLENVDIIREEITAEENGE